VASLAIGLAGARPSAAQGNLLMVLAFYGVLGIVLPRFLMPLPAIAVAETGPALRRAWTLSAGNFPALLAIAIAVFAPGLVIVELVALMAPGGGAAVAAGASEQALVLAALQQQRATLPMASGVAFLVAPLTVGLVSGASVAIWRALSGDASRAAPADS